MQLQTQISANPTRFITRVLRANALYCAGAGMGMLLFPAAIAGWLGMAAGWIIGVLGGVMVLYAGVLWWGGGRRPSTWTRIATTLDLLWIVGSLLLLLTNWLPLTRVGVWAVALAADGVLIFAALQIIGLRRYNRPLS